MLKAKGTLLAVLAVLLATAGLLISCSSPARSATPSPTVVGPKPTATVPAPSPTAPAPKPSPAAKTTFVKLLTSDIGGSPYVMSGALTGLITKYSTAVRITVIPNWGYHPGVRAMQEGDGDMAFCSGLDIPMYVNGTDLWKAIGPFKEIRTMFSAQTSATVIWTRTSANIKDLSDLRGHKIGFVPQYYGAYTLLINLLKAAGYSDPPKDLDLRLLELNDQQTALKEGTIDCTFFLTQHPNASLTDVANSTNVKILSVPDDVINKVDAIYGKGSVLKINLPANTYKGQTQDSPQLGYVSCLTSTTRMSDDVAYEITKTLFDHIDEAISIASYWKWASDPKNATSPTFTAFHPGALKYFKEKGWVK